jgi:hypothetical protein
MQQKQMRWKKETYMKLYLNFIQFQSTHTLLSDNAVECTATMTLSEFESEAFAHCSVHLMHTSGAFINSMSCVRIRYRLVATSLAQV